MNREPVNKAFKGCIIGVALGACMWVMMYLVFMFIWNVAMP